MDSFKSYRQCTRGLWDTTVPGIAFDDDGVSNYAKMFDCLCELYPRGVEGEDKWSKIVIDIKNKSKYKKYDCIVGVSGGTDSSYLLYLAKVKYGLRPLAVNLDNGWSSDIAVENIKKMTTALNIDLITYVINYEEVKVVLRSYMKAGLPWIDSPTDNAISAVLVNTALKEKVSFILNGSDFRSEGKQPSEWTYSDAHQLLHLVKRFENKSLKTYPYQTITKLLLNNFIRGIKVYRPYYFLEYEKKAAQQFLISNFDWKYYGGHHHENIFTKFAIAYWMPRKFNIDKRIITLSAQVLSGEINREEALKLIKQSPYSQSQMELDKDYIIKKLDLNEKEFEEIWNAENKFYWDYPSYMPLINKFSRPIRKYIKYILPYTPTMFIEKLARQ